MLQYLDYFMNTNPQEEQIAKARIWGPPILLILEEPASTCAFELKFANVNKTSPRVKAKLSPKCSIMLDCPSRLVDLLLSKVKIAL